MATPEELRELADRIDVNQNWRLPFFDAQKLPKEEQDRLMAGVHLRRYATGRGAMLEQLKEGAEYMRGVQIPRANRGTDQRGCGDIDWHRAINAESERLQSAGEASPRLMYLAKQVSDELPRLIILFQYEREGRLGKSFKMCAYDPAPATPLPDNHLTCALGKACRDCVYLKAIDRGTTMTPQAKDEAKAWTCVTHILNSTSLPNFIGVEEFVWDKSSAAFDERMVRSMAQEEPPEAG